MIPDTAFRMWKAGFDVARLGLEANAVMWMRVLGMGGAWNTPFDESWRMWREKPQAFVEATGRASEALMRGKTPDLALSAAVIPLARIARGNRQRLARRGPRAR
ncbi:MAG: antifreeze protein [Pseudomonadota bacterium]